MCDEVVSGAWCRLEPAVRGNRDVRRLLRVHRNAFSLTPDPKYLYKSESHANAYELLQYAVRRREGFVVINGDIGTGKKTLCRVLLEEIDRNTFTALVLNPSSPRRSA